LEETERKKEGIREGDIYGARFLVVKSTDERSVAMKPTPEGAPDVVGILTLSDFS
jgi:hypothetical protein